MAVKVTDDGIRCGCGADLTAEGSVLLCEPAPRGSLALWGRRQEVEFVYGRYLLPNAPAAYCVACGTAVDGITRYTM